MSRSASNPGTSDFGPVADRPLLGTGPRKRTLVVGLQGLKIVDLDMLMLLSCSVQRQLLGFLLLV